MNPYDFVMTKHKGQLDKAGEDYVQAHLIPVMNMVRPELKIAAFAHDVLEDTDATIFDMAQAGFHFEDISLVSRLTKREGEALDTYIYRVSRSKEAIEIKIADVVSNLSRIGVLDSKDQERLKRKYFRTLTLLNGVASA